MIIDKADKSGTRKLYISLEKYCRSVSSSRSVTVKVYAHSPYMANIEISVHGLKGEGVRHINIVGTEEIDGDIDWVAYSNGEVYDFDLLSDVANLVKRHVTKLKTLVNKFN